MIATGFSIIPMIESPVDCLFKKLHTKQHKPGLLIDTMQEKTLEEIRAEHQRKQIRVIMGFN